MRGFGDLNRFDRKMSVVSQTGLAIQTFGMVMSARNVG